MEPSNLSRIENPKVGRVAPPTAQISGSNEPLRAAQSARDDTASTQPNPMRQNAAPILTPAEFKYVLNAIK